MDEPPLSQHSEHGVAWIEPHDEGFVESRIMGKFTVMVLDQLQNRGEGIRDLLLRSYEDRHAGSQSFGDRSRTFPIRARRFRVLVRRDQPHVASVCEAGEEPASVRIEDDGDPMMMRHRGNSSGLADLTPPPSGVTTPP